MLRSLSVTDVHLRFALALNRMPDVKSGGSPHGRKDPRAVYYRRQPYP